MKKQIFIFIFLLISGSNAFSQGAPACPSITPTATPPTICQGACTNLNATVVSNNQTNAYTVAAIPYVPYAYTGGTGISVGTDDVWSPVINLGFTFCYFGTPYTQGVVGSNGQLTFDLTKANGYDSYPVTATLPSTSNMPGNTICAVFRDIDPSVSGSCKYYTTGIAPCRALVIYWNNIALFSCGTPHSTFQLVLYENTNYIDVYIQNSAGSCTSWYNGYGIVGIQNAGATTAVCPPGRNMTAFTANNEAWRFSPAGAPSYSVTWTDPSNAVVGTGLGPINVCPTVNTTYTSTMVVTDCNSATTNYFNTVNVTVNPSATPTFNAVAPICSGAALAALPTTSNNGISGTWSPALNNTATTVYTFTPNAGQCGTTTTLTITVDPSTLPTFTAVSPICSGDALAALPTTSNNGITGTWSPALNNTATTTYTFTPTAGQCASTTTLTITVNPSTTPAFTAVSPICSGDALTALPTTSNNSITGSWSPALNNTAATTYTFTPTAGQCAATTTLTITVNPVVTPAFTAVAAICSGAALAALPTTSNNSITGTWSPALNNTATTTYTFTPTAGQCSNTTTLTIVVNPLPVVTVNDTTICAGETATLTASGAGSYTWSAGLSSTSGTTVTGSPATTASYTVTGSTSGCTNTAVSTITVNPMPVLTITNPAPVCSPLTVDITAAAVTTGSTGGGTLSYWTTAGATTALASPTAISTSGTYYIQSITAGGCRDIQPVTVTVNPLPVLSITNPGAVCAPNTIDLTAATVTAGSTGGGTLTYWTDATATTALAAPAAMTTSGTYYIQTTTASGCTDIKPVTITINALPVLVITNPSPVCSPLMVDVTAAAVTAGSTGGGVLSYWTNPGATNLLATPNSVSNSATYYIQSTTVAGCTDIQPVTVLVNTTPVLVITDPAAVCSPLTVDITAPAVTAGSTGGGTLTYWTDAGATTSLTTPTAVTTSGTYYIQAMTAAGCKDIKPVNVTINALPVLVITDPAGVCEPNTVDITASAVTAGSTGSGALTYWTTSGATTAVATPASMAVNGTYYIQSMTAGGCSDIQPVTITINTLPVLTITNPANVCSPLTVDITDPSVTAGSTGGGTLTYWTDATATTLLTTPTAVAAGGTYYIQTITASGCKDINPVLVTIDPLPVLIVTDPASVCAPGTVNITDPSVTAGSTGSGSLTYWTDATATTALANPTAVSTSGTYYIQSTTAAGCIDINPVVVTINPLPTPLFVADNLSGCSPVCVNFTDGSIVASGTLTNWNWDFGGEGTSTTQNPSFCFTTPGQYNVTLSVTTNNGCNSISSPLVITVFQDPIAEFNPTPNPASVLDATVTLNNQSSLDVTYWHWTFGDGDSLSPNTPSPLHTYPNDMAGNYTATLIVHNADGCYATVSHDIIIAAEFTFFIPNAFTPNGDGINDTFYGQGIGIEKYEIFIFDRWGNNVFYGDDVSKAWDGKANHGSEIAQEDVYVWKVKLLDVLGKKHNYIGTVTISK